MHAVAFAQINITKSADEIAKDVLENGGVGLTINERKQLPNLILQSKFDSYQDAFANEVLANYSGGIRFWARLFRAWLLEYNPSSSLGKLVVSTLKEHAEKLPPNFIELQTKYPVLELNPDFSETAWALLDNRMQAEDRIALGLNDGGVVFTRLATKILMFSANLLSKGNATEDQIRRFQSIVAPSGRIHESVKLVAMIGLILSTVARPPSNHQIKEISNLIEENFDDPVASKHRWPSVPDELGGVPARELCLKTVRKWQVFRSITLFFSIIEQVVASDHMHQFPVRREFWLRYFDRGEVTDAWVILGSLAEAQIAKLIQQGGDDYKALRWAKLGGGPPDQCALLMKLGDTTVMEFSHSGKVRMWGKIDGNGQLNTKIPVLHRSSYRTEGLRAECPSDQMFTHDNSGNWRVKASRCINKIAGRSTKL